MSARVTQAFAQVLGTPRNVAKTSQAFLQVLSNDPIEQAVATQVFLQVLSSRPPVAAEGSIPAREIIFVAEIHAIDDAGDPVVALVTDSPGWRTKPTDTPAGAHVIPALDNPGTFTREMFRDGRAFGIVRPSFGVATIKNLNSRFDGWKSYGFDGQVYCVRWGRHGAAYPADFQVAFQCTMAAGEVDFDVMRLRLRDRSALLDRPILNRRFLGTGGLEGSAGMAEQPMQRAIGDPIYFPLQPILQEAPVLRYTEPTDAFLDLSDTPDSYAGAGAQVVAVKPTLDGVEFTDLSFLDLSDVPLAYTGAAGRMLVVSDTEDGIDFVDPTFLGLADTPNDFAGDGTKLLAVNAAEDAIEFVALSTVAGSVIQSLLVAIGADTAVVATGAAQLTFRFPFAFTVSAVRANLVTAQASGAIVTVDINLSGVSMLSTKLTIDNGEKTSATAATAAVISDAGIADDEEVTIDVDQVGDGTAKGLKVTIIGTKA